jgi:hypothetical protein
MSYITICFPCSFAWWLQICFILFNLPPGLVLDNAVSSGTQPKIVGFCNVLLNMVPRCPYDF